MRSAMILLAAVAVLGRAAILQMDELREMINDKKLNKELKSIGNDKKTARGALTERVSSLIASQSNETQYAYHLFVEGNALLDEAIFRRDLIKLLNKGTSSAALEARSRLFELKTDMSLSQKEYENRVKDYKKTWDKILSKSDQKELDNLKIKN